MNPNSTSNHIHFRTTCLHLCVDRLIHIPSSHEPQTPHTTPLTHYIYTPDDAPQIRCTRASTKSIRSRKTRARESRHIRRPRWCVFIICFPRILLFLRMGKIYTSSTTSSPWMQHTHTSEPRRICASGLRCDIIA